MKSNQKLYSAALATAALLALAAAPAQGDVTISSAATKNMTCSGGICSPTANKANLSVSDLESTLKSGNATVTTTGSGSVQANNITIDAALTWKSANVLTLSALANITVMSPVSVTGSGGLTLSDGGKESLAFYNGANVTFSNLSSALTINESTYLLVGNISELATDVSNNNSGSYALARDYDASGDGTYPGAPIQPDFNGNFEGLGNAISSLTINDTAAEDPLDGFFRTLGGTVTNFGLFGISVSNNPSAGGAGAGTIAGNFHGTIWRCWATGQVNDGFSGGAGGLVAGSGGIIMQSWTDVAVTLLSGNSAAGGIAGSTGNGTIIEQSFAIGPVASDGDTVALGGLVGSNYGQILQSYSTAAITLNYQANNQSALGGLIGWHQAGLDPMRGAGSLVLDETYSIGAIAAPASGCDSSGNPDNCIGGWIGVIQSGAEQSFKSNYWDLDTSNVSHRAQGVGNVPKDKGVKGLTTAQFVATLPKGFNTKVWAENPNINGGYPYLIANPPPK